MFVLLAAVTLASLALLAALDFHSSARFADRAAVVRQESMTADLTRILANAVDANAQYLDQQAEIASLALRLDVAAVERSLDQPPPEVPLYFGERFDGPRAGWPPQTKLVRLGDAPTQIPNSYAVGVVTVPRGADRTALHPDLLRLASTVPTARALDAEHPGLFLAQLTGLENGAHLNFPGHGNWPADYDVRKTLFYQKVKAVGERLWSPPIFTAATKQLAFTVAMPIRRRDGSFAGVSANVIAIVDVLRALKRRTVDQGQGAGAAVVPLSENAASILVVPVRRAGLPEALQILAQRSYNQNLHDWHVAPALDLISGANDPRYQAVVHDISAGRSGVARLPFDGLDSLWAYSPVTAFHAALLFVVPYGNILSAAAAASQPLRTAALAQLRESGALGVAIVLLMAVLSAYLASVAARPVQELATAARRIGSGDLEARVPVRGSDEIADLAMTFNAMVPALQRGLRLQQGLELAKTVQQNLLPLSPPQIPGFDIAGLSVYCDETGGDYYDFLDVSNDAEPSLTVAVGDVSGHGIGSALLMSSVRAMLRTSVVGREPPGRAMERANRLLCEDVHDGTFMTLILLTVQACSGTVRWVNAAHDPALLYCRDSDAFLATGGTEVAIGIDAGWRFTEQQLKLPAGDFVLAMGTDGIWETEDGAGAPFGRARFRELVRAHAAESAAEACRAIMAEVAQFRGDQPLRDDSALVVVKFSALAVAA